MPKAARCRSVNAPLPFPVVSLLETGFQRWEVIVPCGFIGCIVCYHVECFATSVACDR